MEIQANTLILEAFLNYIPLLDGITMRCTGQKGFIFVKRLFYKVSETQMIVDYILMPVS